MGRSRLHHLMGDRGANALRYPRHGEIHLPGINKNWLVDPFAIKVDRRLDLVPVLQSLRWRLTGPSQVSDTLPGVARSHESLWLGASATLATGALALVGANVAFDTVRQHYKFWTNGIMVGAYAVGVLAVFCFFAAMREWPMPLAGDRPHRREAHTLTPQDPAEAGSAGDVTLTPRQFGDKLVLDVRNNGPAASFTAEVIFIFRSNGDGTPDTAPGWAVPWAANGKACLSTDAAEIPHGQQRTLDLARYDPAAVQASRSGDTSGPHWLFSSLPEPVGFSYWPPIASGRDLSARRFVVTLRVFRSSPPGWSDHTLGVGVSGSAIVCEPLPLKVEVIETDWRDRELRDFIVAARVQVQNSSGKTVRLSPVHWMQAATPGVIAAEPGRPASNQSRRVR